MNQRYNNEEKAKIYNRMLHQFQRLQEEVRLIKAIDVEVSDENQKKINFLEAQMRRIYNDTQNYIIEIFIVNKNKKIDQNGSNSKFKK